YLRYLVHFHLIRLSSIFIPFFSLHLYYLFFFNTTSPTEIYTLSLHDALPIYLRADRLAAIRKRHPLVKTTQDYREILAIILRCRSEEHTSELQSRENLVCRLLLEKKKKNKK